MSSRAAEDEPETVDALFRSAMSDWRKSERASLGESTPVVVRRESTLTLHWNGDSHPRNVTGDEYDLLQQISHYPLASFLFAHEELGRSRGNLESLIDLITAKIDGPKAGPKAMDAEAWAAMEKVQTLCADFLKHRLENEGLRYEVVEDFSEELSPHLSHFIEVAAELEITALDEAMEAFARKVPKSSWRRAHFVVCGGRQPRYKNITKVYFEHYLGESGDPDRRFENKMIYCEGAESDEDALEHLANHLVNQRLGRVFLGSPLALQQDVLGDAARRSIERLRDRTSAG